MFVVQSKHRGMLPQYLWNWLAGICGVAQDRGKVGIVVLSKPRQDRADAVVLMRYADFVALHGVPKDEEPAA